MENVQSFTRAGFFVCQNFTRKCVNYDFFMVATKQGKLNTNATNMPFRSLHKVHSYIHEITSSTHKSKVQLETMRIYHSSFWGGSRSSAGWISRRRTALLIWASWSPMSLPWSPWRQSSSWERIHDKIFFFDTTETVHQEKKSCNFTEHMSIYQAEYLTTRVLEYL